MDINSRLQSWQDAVAVIQSKASSLTQDSIEQDSLTISKAAETVLLYATAIVTSSAPSTQLEACLDALATAIQSLTNLHASYLQYVASSLFKLLKALQTILQQIKNTINLPLNTLVPSLQRSLSIQSTDIGRATTTKNSKASSPCQSPTKYIPPRARSRSDTESGSEAEYNGNTSMQDKSIRLRVVTLTIFQLIIKSNPKTMHPYWTTLLPSTNVTSFNTSTSTNTSPSLAHLMLYDASSKVRHAAAVTITTLLEGPAQRAYLAIAEAKQLARQSIRGFITMSASLGQAIVHLHQALLHVLDKEQDVPTLIAVLRALCTLLIGAPYHRLPAELLVMCTEKLAQAAQRALSHVEPSIQDGVLGGCMSALAGVFAVKPASPELQEWLESDIEGKQLVDMLFHCAYHAVPAVELEGTMALRGLVQQYPRAMDCSLEQWTSTLQLIIQGQNSSSEFTTPPASPGRAQNPQGGSIEERVVGQWIRWAADYLICWQISSSDQQSISSLWNDFILAVIIPAIQHGSTVIKTAAVAAVASSNSDGTSSMWMAVSDAEISSLVQMVCRLASTDSVSTVRAAACKSLASILPVVGTQDMDTNILLVSTLEMVCRDQVLAVRIQAAATLANFTSALYSTAPIQGLDIKSRATLLQLAINAMSDSEKIKVHAVHALGSAAALAIRGQPTTDGVSGVDDETSANRIAEAVGILQQTLVVPNNNNKLHWAACEAAQPVINAASRNSSIVQTDVASSSSLVDTLLNLVQDSPNTHTRVLSIKALQGMEKNGCDVGAIERIIEVLSAVDDGRENDAELHMAVQTCLQRLQ